MGGTMGPGKLPEDAADEEDDRTGGGAAGGFGTNDPSAFLAEPLFPAGVFKAIAGDARDASGARGAAVEGKLEAVVGTYQKADTNMDARGVDSNINPDRENVGHRSVPVSKDGKKNPRTLADDEINNKQKQVGGAGNLSQAGDRAL